MNLTTLQHTALYAALWSTVLFVPACGGVPPGNDNPSASAKQTASAPQTTPTSVWGFAWASGGTSGGYWADSNWACASVPEGGSGYGCGGIWINHLATGSYNVTFPGLAWPGDGDPNRGNVQAVATGGGTTQCQAAGGAKSGSDVIVGVVCFNSSGLADSDFTVSYVRRSDTPGPEGAYLWAASDDNPINTPYTPDEFWQWSSTGSSGTVTRTATGIYNVTLPGQNFTGGSVQVNAPSFVGFGPPTLRYCKAATWFPSGSTTNVEVRCFNQTGVATNSTFYLNFSRDWPSGGNQYGYVWADNSTAASYTPHTTYQQGVLNGAGAYPQFIGTITAGRYSTGSYFVDIPEVDSLYSTLKVTGHGSTTTTCKVADWYLNGSNTRVDISCFNPSSGSAADTTFALVYTTAWYIDW